MIDPGTVLESRYRIVRLLGEGAMGAVYEAEHVVVGGRVAVKVLHAHFARLPGAVKRFGREARAAAQIGHPNIVKVIDAGTHADAPFLVMELLRGETLRERLARHETLPTATACEIVGTVLSALASAHARGIVHRDLKPDNVFLAERDGQTTVKLLDFGVSKFRQPGVTHDTTLEGLPIGTPAYMAPEQWMGRRDIDHRADLFAVGAILYELLTGGMPYEGASQGELFLEVVRGTEAPPTPSAIAPEVPPAIDALVLRALLRDRETRFQSAQRFLDALRPFGADGIQVVDEPAAPVPEEPDVTSPRRAAQRVSTRVDGLFAAPRPHRTAFVLAALAALACVGFALRTSAPARRAPPTVVTATRANAPPATRVNAPPAEAPPAPVAALAAPPPETPALPNRSTPHRARTTPRPPRAGGIGSLRISHQF